MMIKSSVLFFFKMGENGSLDAERNEPIERNVEIGVEQCP